MIWVRSQDKETLLMVDKLYIIEDEMIDKYCIYTDSSVDTCYGLGAYSTKEKAMNILNAIEWFISENEERKSTGWKYNKENTVVFQMPADYD